MNDSATSDTAAKPAARPSRGRQLRLAAAAAGYVMAGTVGLVAGAHTIGFTPLLWVLYAIGLLVLLGRLGGGEAGCSAAAFVLLVTGLSYVIGSAVWDDLVLQERGKTVQAVVMKERQETGSRGDKTWYYHLIQRDGIAVPGPELESDSDRFDVGQTITVVEDPKGELAPETPGETSPAGDLLGVGGALAVCLGAVGWTAYRGRRGKNGRPSFLERKAAAFRKNGVPTADQERRLRDLLRARHFDRRGYIRVSPGAFRGLTQQQAARIAREEGLRTEAFGNRGYWRFGEQVVEELRPEPDSSAQT